MAGVWRTKNTRLGMKLGSGSLGWALIQRQRPKPVFVEQGDPLDVARRAARENAAVNQSLTIYVYANDKAFAGSRGKADGMTRAEHRVAMERIASTLADEGFDIVLCEVE